MQVQTSWDQVNYYQAVHGHILNLSMRIIAYATGVLDLLGLGWGSRFLPQIPTGTNILTPFPGQNKM